MTAPAGARFHHLGLFLRQEDGALAFLRRMGYEAGEKIHDPEQDVHVRLCMAALMPAVEIVLPGKGKTPLDLILKNSVEMIYHTCYEVNDPAVFLEVLGADGIRYKCISPPKPAVLFGGRCVSFYHIRGYGIIELLQA